MTAKLWPTATQYRVPFSTSVVYMSGIAVHSRGQPPGGGGDRDTIPRFEICHYNEFYDVCV